MVESFFDLKVIFPSYDDSWRYYMTVVIFIWVCLFFFTFSRKTLRYHPGLDAWSCCSTDVVAERHLSQVHGIWGFKIHKLYGRKRRVSQRCVNPGFFKGGFLMIFLCSKRVGLHSLLHFFPICRFWWFGAAYAVIFAWHDLGKLHSVESVRRSALAIQSAKWTASKTRWCFV